MGADKHPMYSKAERKEFLSKYIEQGYTWSELANTFDTSIEAMKALLERIYKDDPRYRKSRATLPEGVRIGLPFNRRELHFLRKSQNKKHRNPPVPFNIVADVLGREEDEVKNEWTRRYAPRFKEKKPLAEVIKMPAADKRPKLGKEVKKTVSILKRMDKIAEKLSTDRKTQPKKPSLAEIVLEATDDLHRVAVMVARGRDDEAFDEIIRIISVLEDA